jgi:hypothetical protein
MLWLSMMAAVGLGWRSPHLQHSIEGMMHSIQRIVEAHPQSFVTSVKVHVRI